jgi:hypothetical protein
MILVHIVAFLRRLLKNTLDCMIEAAELRRTMARRYPRMEE